MPIGSEALEASVSRVLLSSAHLSTGADSALDQGEEGMALACWEPTFWFMSQEIHRGQNQKAGQVILQPSAPKGIPEGGSLSQY